MRGRLVEDRTEERICKIRVIDGVIANYYPQEELTRCKDCKKFVVEEDQAYCLDMYGQCDENGFCAWAERKDK